MTETNIEKINRLIAQEIRAYYGDLSMIRQQLASIAINTAADAKMVMDAMDKGASVLDKLQPLLRQAHGIDDRKNEDVAKMGGMIALALAAAEGIVDRKKDEMKVIENVTIDR